MANKKFIVLFLFYISYLWFTTFGMSILPTHFLEQHLTLQQMMFGSVLRYTSQLSIQALLLSFSSKLSWRLALILALTYILLSIRIFSPFQFYIASVIGGFSMFFFYILYNIAHFEHTPKERKGHSSALMFIAPSVIGIVAPLLAGYIAQIHILFVWIIAFLSFLVSFYVVRFQKNFTITYTIRRAIQEIKATRVFIVLEGIWEALPMGVIPIYTLYFIKTPLSYGLFLAYLALVSIIANFTLGKVTDKLQKRILFLYPITIILAFTTMLFTTVQSNLTYWIILTGIIQFLLPLFWNVSTAMVVDAHPNLRLAMPGREFLLAVGRIVGLSLAFVSFSVEKTPFFIFLILGGVFLLYPIVLLWNTKISKKYSYL